MDRIVVKKFKTEIKIAILIAVLSLALLCAMVFTYYRSVDLNKKITSGEDELKQCASTVPGNVDIIIKLKESIKANLEQEHIKLKDALSKTKLKNEESLTPLSFKKMLFDTQDQILADASRRDIVMPQDLGFEEYRLLVPEAAIVPILTRELLFFEEIISFLIENKVYAVKNIKLPHKTVIFDIKAQGLEQDSFESLSMEFSVETEFNQLKGFLMDLAKSDKNYVVSKINIKRTDETSRRLFAEVNIKSIEL